MLRWGILGTGFISGTVVGAIDASPGSEVVAVAGRSDGRVASFAATHSAGDRAWFSATDYQAVIEHPSVDAIYIGTPNHVHAELAVAAAVAGKAILSEKSLTTTMPDAHRLIAAVGDNKVFFVEGLMYLAHPLAERFVELLAHGRVGKIRSIHGRYGASIADVVNPLGRGTIYNLGCYPASLLHLTVQVLCGDGAFGNHTVEAVGNIDAETGTVTEAGAVIRFDDGILATLQSSDHYGNVSDFSVAGDHGVLRFKTNPWLPNAGENTIVWTPHEQPDRSETITVTTPHDAFFHQIAMVEKAVAAGRLEAPRPSPRWQDSIEIMQLLTDWEAACLAQR